MRFTEEQIQFQDTISFFLKDKITSEYLRSRIESSQTRDDSLWKDFKALGLFEYFFTKQGQGGGTLTDLGIIAFEAGKVVLPESLTDHLFAGPYILSRLDKTDLDAVSDYMGDDFLSKVISTEEICVFAGFEKKPPKTNALKKPSVLKHEFQHLPAYADSTVLLMPAEVAGGQKICLLKLDGKADRKSTAAYIDGSLKLGSVKVEKASFITLNSLSVDEVCSEYYALLSCSLAGSSHKALALSLKHAKARTQYGKPIAAFQAVQHALSEMHLKAEAMYASANFACFAADFSREQLSLAAHSALRYSRDAAVDIAEQAIQVHGGIGFTWEYDLHFYLRRANMLKALTSYIYSEKFNKNFIEFALNK